MLIQGSDRMGHGPQSEGPSESGCMHFLPAPATAYGIPANEARTRMPAMNDTGRACIVLAVESILPERGEVSRGKASLDLVLGE